MPRDAVSRTTNVERTGRPASSIMVEMHALLSLVHRNLFAQSETSYPEGFPILIHGGPNKILIYFSTDDRELLKGGLN